MGVVDVRQDGFVGPAFSRKLQLTCFRVACCLTFCGSLLVSPSVPSRENRGASRAGSRGQYGLRTEPGQRSSKGGPLAALIYKTR